MYIRVTFLFVSFDFFPKIFQYINQIIVYKILMKMKYNTSNTNLYFNSNF